MVRTLAVALILGAPGIALACGGDKTTLASASESAAPAAVDPTHCAKQAELVGGNCSYSTGMMAQQVLDQGKPYTFTGTLVAAANELKSRVATPFVVGPQGATHVIANEVVESLVAQGAGQGRVTLAGRLLEVDGVQYFVATEFEKVNS